MKKTIIAVVISGTTALGLALSSSIAFAQSQSTTGQLTNDVKQGWNKTKDKAADVKQDIQNKLGDNNASSAPAVATTPSSDATNNNTTNISVAPASTTKTNTNASTPTTEHKYMKKTHYKHHYYHNDYKVHHDINWSADQHMARTGYEAPPRGWNGLGVPRVIPKGDNPKWYYVNYGYSQEEKNDFKWHRYHHNWKGHSRVYHRDTDGNVTYEDQ